MEQRYIRMQRVKAVASCRLARRTCAVRHPHRARAYSTPRAGRTEHRHERDGGHLQEEHREERDAEHLLRRRVQHVLVPAAAAAAACRCGRRAARLPPLPLHRQLRDLLVPAPGTLVGQAQVPAPPGTASD